MIECPSCHHQEFVGTLFCSECGSRLIHVSPMPTVPIPVEQINQEARATRPGISLGPSSQSGAILGLRILPEGEVMPLIGRDNYTLGRAMEGQAVIPDIDLGSHEAYDSGVSRIHAEIRIEGDGIYLVDLDSVNGTLVNGKQLEPQTPAPIGHGDMLQLGKLRIQLISRVKG